MKKLKIYLDTSIISHLYAKDAPERMSDTLELWRQIKDGIYDVLISNITFEEISHCNEPKRSIMADFISQIEFSNEDETRESLELVDNYLKFGVLNSKSRDDLRHISLATVCKCDIIASWNFKHFVNIKVINKVQAVNKYEGYSEIQIFPPNMIIGGDENEN